MTTTPATPAAGEAVPFDFALAAVRRLANQLEADGTSIDIVADALFSAAAGRLAALSGEREAVFDMTVIWKAIARAAELKRGVDDARHD